MLKKKSGLALFLVLFVGAYFYPSFVEATQPCQTLNQWLNFTSCTYQEPTATTANGSLAISPDGSYLVYGAYNNHSEILFLYNIASQEIILEQDIFLPGRIENTDITSLAISPQNDKIAVLTQNSQNRQVKIVDVIKPNEVIAKWEETSKFCCGIGELIFSADGQFIAYMDIDTITLRSVATTEVVQVVEGQQIAFSPDRTHFAILKKYGEVELWKFQDQQIVQVGLLAKLPNVSTDQDNARTITSHINFSLDGQSLGFATLDEFVMKPDQVLRLGIWDIASQKNFYYQEEVIPTETKINVVQVAFNEEGFLLAMAQGSGEVAYSFDGKHYDGDSSAQLHLRQYTMGGKLLFNQIQEHTSSVAYFSNLAIQPLHGSFVEPQPAKIWVLTRIIGTVETMGLPFTFGSSTAGFLESWEIQP